MFSNPWVLGGIGAAALALIGLLFARRRKKEEPASDFGDAEHAADDHGGYFPAERAPAAIAEVGDAEEGGSARPGRDESV
ncbi:MAG: LPXTG cell wall anchor domain-containing protein [Rhodanobacteraceae bacterium]|nr:LPXTG cell wall anchor domain-containing protein [Rhodanobacteraceae bacterium]